VLAATGRAIADRQQPGVSLERRMMVEEDARDLGLPLAGRGGHRRDDHSVADYRLRIALEKIVGNRRQVEKSTFGGSGSRLGPHPADKRLGQLPGLQVGQPGQGRRNDPIARLHLGQDLLAQRRLLEHLGQQVLRVEGLGAGQTQDLAEPSVLSSRLGLGFDSNRHRRLVLLAESNGWCACHPAPPAAFYPHQRSPSLC
jgi:hypothetical protein